MNMGDCFSVIDHSKFENVLRNFAQQNRLTNENVSPFLNEIRNVFAPAYTFGDRHIEMIEVLVDAGANLHSRDNEGNIPLHCIAANSPNVETIEHLLALCAETIEHLLALCAETIEHLLALCADPQARDHEG
jgi:hypothetical protein